MLLNSTRLSLADGKDGETLIMHLIFNRQRAVLLTLIIDMRRSFALVVFGVHWGWILM